MIIYYHIDLYIYTQLYVPIYEVDEDDFNPVSGFVYLILNNIKNLDDVVFVLCESNGEINVTIYMAPYQYYN